MGAYLYLMDGAPEAISGSRPRWHTIAVIAVVLGAAWWVWKRHAKAAPDVPVQANTPAPVDPLPGISPNIVTKLARVPDAQIPVVMTSGASVQYGDDEVRQVIRLVLDRLNSMGERVSLIQLTSASKTLDSYKTVAYDIVFFAHDARENVGMLLSLSALVPVSGKLYVRSLKMYNTPADRDPGPPAAGDNPRAALAEYEDPVTALSKVKLS